MKLIRYPDHPTWYQVRVQHVYHGGVCLKLAGQLVHRGHGRWLVAPLGSEKHYVSSETKAREALKEGVRHWLAENPKYELSS